MVRSSKVLLLLSLIFISCGKSYENTQAKIIDTETEGKGEEKNFVATFEYQINDSTYQSSFKVNVWSTIEDTLLTPMPGVTFDIQYNTKDPSDIIVDYKVKPGRINGKPL